MYEGGEWSPRGSGRSFSERGCKKRLGTIQLQLGEITTLCLAVCKNLPGCLTNPLPVILKKHSTHLCTFFS